MLATLHLQLSPVELLDDALITTPAPQLPDSGGEAESGFAELLRLRVHVPLAPGSAGGEVLLPESELLPQGVDLTPPPGQSSPPAGQSLPPAGQSLPPAGQSLLQGGESLPRGGSELPIPGQEFLPKLAKEILPTPKLSPQPVAGSDETPGSERPEIALETPVLYPPSENLATEVPAPLTLPILSPASNSGALDSRVVAAETDATDALAAKPLPPDDPRPTRPEVAARLQRVLAAAGERIDTPYLGTGLRDRGPSNALQTRIISTIPTTQSGDSNEHLPLIDLPKRPEPAPVQRAAVLAEQLSDMIQQRAVVPQPVQTLHAEPNTQSPQPMLAAAPGTAAAGELTVATGARQAIDLIGTPVRDSSWGEQLSERVVLMAGNQHKTAEIRLTPAELGPLRVRVSVDDGAANVTFLTQHAVTREAIEQALPRLREMLAENGLSLGQADVSEQGVAQGNEDGQTDNPVSNQAGDDGHDPDRDDDSQRATRITASNGLVDTFA